MSGVFSGYFGGNETARFVGQVVDLGDDNKLKIKKVIAEGGYGYVFVAQDTRTGQDYALKRQVVSRENTKVVKKEIAFLKQLSNHPHIIQYIASAGCPPTQTSHGNAEFLIQTELCTGGPLEAVVRENPLSPGQVLRVFHATCSAVAAMHSQRPPIIHRDLKVENLLLTSEGVVKLCDFGSATTEQVNPDPSWSSVQRGLAEDEIQRNTTPMYRSPEMVDLYSNHPVNQKSDIWALGCLLFSLCFRTHPFEDSAKLRILNANYKLPADDTVFVPYHYLIKACLVVDPIKRPSIDELIAQLYTLSDQLSENLEQPLTELLDAQSTAPPTSEEGERSTWASTSQQAQKLFGFMKEGAGSLFKNFKDSSSRVIHSMSSANKKSVDISYITSRLLVMGGGSEQLEEGGAWLEEHHPAGYLLFNLTGQSYEGGKFQNQVYEFSWPLRGTPELEKLVDLCRSMDAWLRAERGNVVVLHCSEGGASAVTAAAYFLFLGLVNSPAVALKLYWKKRQRENIRMGSPSQMRYLQHIVQLVDRDFPYKPHPHKLILRSLALSSVPLFNAIRTGCKPFVEVYQDGDRVFTSATNDSMDKIQSFHGDDGGLEVPLGVEVRGNVVVIVHHIRAIPVARKAGLGMTAVKMFQLQVHTGFLDPYTESFVMERHDVDGSAVKKADKFPSPFRVTLEVKWEREAGSTHRAASWQNLPYPKATPLSCFASRVEEQEVLKLIVDTDNEKSPRHVKPSRPHPPRPHPPKEEDTSAGSGNLVQLSHDPPQVSHDLIQTDVFDQSEWRSNQAEMEGYHAFQDQNGESESDSSSSDSSSSSDDEFGGFTKTHSQDLISNFTAVSTADSAPSGKLVDLSFSNDYVSSSSQSEKTAVSALSDPWPTSQAAAGVTVSNLLGLDDSDDHSQLSDIQSELRAAGAEQFSSRIEEMGNKKNNKAESAFDPFDGLLTGSSSQPTVTTPAVPQASPQTSFDPFDTFGLCYAPNQELLNPQPVIVPSTGSQGNSPRSSVTASPVPTTTKSHDPFAQFNIPTMSTSKPSIVPSQQTSQKPHPAYTPYYMQKGGGEPRPPPSQPPRSTSPRPNYTPSFSAPPTKTGVPQKPKEDAFGDLLGSGFNSGRNEPRSLNAMRPHHVEEDPDKARVSAWAARKERNIRALLSSLHEVLWEGEARWTAVGMHQLVQPEQVKKMFRKASLSVHPDKTQDTGHAKLARAIFDELNDAYSRFEESGSQALF